MKASTKIIWIMDFIILAAVFVLNWFAKPIDPQLVTIIGILLASIGGVKITQAVGAIIKKETKDEDTKKAG